MRSKTEGSYYIYSYRDVLYFLVIQLIIPITTNTILIHCDTDIPNIIPLIKSPLKNSNANLMVPYKIQYNPIILSVCFDF